MEREGLMKKMDPIEYSFGLLSCNSLMCKPSHVLRNSIRDAPTSPVPRGIGVDQGSPTYATRACGAQRGARDDWGGS